MDIKYIEQKERMHRLFLKINPPSGNHGNQTDYEDNLWYFFQTAWHLKDWIKNDPSLKTFEIEKIVENYHSLRICADLANRSKHLKLTRHIREDAKYFGNDVTVRLGVSEIDYEDLIKGKIPMGTTESVAYTYYIIDKSTARHKAIDLASQIIKDWDDIIKKYITS